MSKRNIVNIKPASTGLGEFGASLFGSVIVTFQSKNGDTHEYHFTKQQADKLMKGHDAKHLKGTHLRTTKSRKQE